MHTLKRAWYPTVTLCVFGMGVASAVTGNELSVTVALFGLAAINAGILIARRRDGSQ